MRAVVYYVPQPMPLELHGLERLIYEDLTTAEARALMRVPAVREPGNPLEQVHVRDRVFNRHEDNRVLLYNVWGITDVFVAHRRYYMTNLIPLQDLETLERGDA